MDGLTLLDEARAAGLKVAAKGDKLVVSGPRRAESVARKLLASKREVMAALVARPTADAAAGAADSTEAANWREYYAERAAIREFEAGYRREVAERLAFCEAVEAWCRHHPQHHTPDTCAGCQQPLKGNTLDLPDGARVHFNDNRFECLIAYGSSCSARAKAALAGLGLPPPEGCSA